jgi:hypothetical protein
VERLQYCDTFFNSEYLPQNQQSVALNSETEK